MEEMKVTPRELKDLITESRILGEGFFGSVFKYKDHLIKLDRQLLYKLKWEEPKYSEEIVRWYYGKGRSHFVDPNQIENLVKKQPNITLTQLPKGIIQTEGHTVGILLPFHKDHNNLVAFDREDRKNLLLLLRNLLLEVQELADNQIAQEDFSFGVTKHGKTNVLYKDTTPQIIDLDGDYVKVGDTFQNSEEMYKQLGNMVLRYFAYYEKSRPDLRDKARTDQDVKIILDELEEVAERTKK